MADPSDVLGFDQQSKEVATRFLRNVLLIDDAAHMHPSVHGGRDHAEPVETPNVSDIGGALPGVDPRAAGTDSLDATELVRAFAKLGLMCAPLVPQVDGAGGDAEFVSSVANAARRADILVLDWWMGPERSWDEQQLAEKVLRRVLKDDEDNHGRLRLVAIYTAETDLHRIVSSLEATMEDYYQGAESFPNSPTPENEDNWISKGPVRLVVIPKGIGAHGENWVPEAVLPDRLVEEYATLTRGLLRNVAFLGLSVLRERAHQLLATFTTDTDPAFLIHRALLPEPDDAEGHVLEILGAELLAILEEQRVGMQAGDAAINNWLAELDPTQFGEVKGLLDWGDDDAAAWARVLIEGVSMESRPQTRGVTRDDVDALVIELKDKGTLALVEGIQSGTVGDLVKAAADANHHFANLMKMRNVYTTRPPYLTLGTVLYRVSDEQYFVCIQAKCDSVRLRTSTPFPLLGLTVARGKQKFDLVVKNADNDWVRLAVQPKTKNLILPKFKPDPTRRIVLATQQGDCFTYRDDDGDEYRWVSTMRDEHALKVARDFSDNLSRPGPNDSEWLRLGPG